MRQSVKRDFDADNRVVVSLEERGKFERMIKWMLDNGAVLNKMKIRWLGPDYRGVIATRDIKAGEQFMFVPPKIILSGDMVVEQPEYKVYSENEEVRKRLDCLTSLYMLNEMRKPDSFWRPYFDILPTDFSNFPMFFSPEEVAMTQGS